MNLTDYDDGRAPLNPDIDPRASQRIAAQKRARPGRPQHDTEPITPLRRSRQYLAPASAVGCVLVVALILTRLPSVPTPTALAITPSAAPTTAPAAPTATAEQPHTISAYAAPNGAVLGPIEIDRMMTPRAHFGTAWIQADVEGSGLVWVKAADVPDLAVIGPDLAPVAAAPAQTGRGLTIKQPAPIAAPEPTSAPSYLDNVAAQAPHSPRGGYCGPTSGDCAPGVPVGIDTSQYLANVAAQAPHKVR